ncbi:MAG TPA: sensor histidine kinase N-terminal domain-containing protein, partial [Trichormus sp.]
MLSVACAALCYWLALQLANEIYDELLFNTADSVVARIDYVAGKRIFDFPKSAQALFRHQDKDKFYYQVHTQDGGFVYGDADLPGLSADAAEPRFADAKMRGEPVRMVSMFNQVPNQIEKPLVVTVAETCNARIAMAQK